MSRAVLVFSPHAGRAAQKIDRARRALVANGAEIVAELRVDSVAELPEVVRKEDAETVVAAGGDGTVGAVADRIANSATVLLVMPLGTSNDFARSLRMPMNVEAAAALLARGKISAIDLGRFEQTGRPSRHFAHAATIGLNVNFAKLATRASLRRRFGRFTYMVAAAVAVRERTTFDCSLSSGSQSNEFPLMQLSVINAPIFGGFLGLHVRGSSCDDGLLDVLAVENLPRLSTLLVGLYQLLRVQRPVGRIHALHTDALMVKADQALDVTLDGEVAGKLPGRFAVAPLALRVFTPLDFA